MSDILLFLRIIISTWQPDIKAVLSLSFRANRVMITLSAINVRRPTDDGHRFSYAADQSLAT
jgi:hypothetical protein